MLFTKKLLYIDMYSIYTIESVQIFGEESEQCQKLKRLIKSWGESDTVQLSGLLAVHGWFVSCEKETKTTINVNGCGIKGPT